MYEKIQEMCSKKGITITALCKEVTGSTGNISTWKKDYMRSDYLSAVADKLDCTTDYLLDRTDNTNIETIPSDSDANTFDVQSEFLQAFNRLNFPDKIKVIQYVLDLNASSN